MIGYFVDVTDIYYKVNRKFGAKVDYNAYLGLHEDLIAYAYCSQRAPGFLACLREAGFEPKIKRPKIIKINGREIKHCDWGVTICMDVINKLNDLDVVVLGVSNPDYIPLIQYCKDCGVKVIVHACCVPDSIRKIADDVHEISEEELEDDEG